LYRVNVHQLLRHMYSALKFRRKINAAQVVLSISGKSCKHKSTGRFRVKRNNEFIVGKGN